MTTSDLMQISERKKWELNKAWCGWLNGLPAYAYRIACANELELYDAFETGQMTLWEIQEQVFQECERLHGVRPS